MSFLATAIHFIILCYFIALAVRHITGSKLLINVLNSLNLCISYTKLLEYDNALANVEANKDEDVIIPSNIVAEIPVAVAFDNIDFAEETLTGMFDR